MTHNSLRGIFGYGRSPQELPGQVIAILLLGGDKTGNNRWYDENIPVADDRYDDYLRELKKEGLI